MSPAVKAAMAVLRALRFEAHRADRRIAGPRTLATAGTASTAAAAAVAAAALAGNHVVDRASVEHSHVGQLTVHSRLGANFRGALYDARRVLNAQHRSAVPRLREDRYTVAAVGLTPYGHLTDSHFYASTAPWILQLLAILPPSVPISCLSAVCGHNAHLGVLSERLHTLPPGGAAYADSLLLVTAPFGALEPLGAIALGRNAPRSSRCRCPGALRVLVLAADQAPAARCTSELPCCESSTESCGHPTCWTSFAARGATRSG